MTKIFFKDELLEAKKKVAIFLSKNGVSKDNINTYITLVSKKDIDQLLPFQTKKEKGKKLTLSYVKTLLENYINKVNPSLAIYEKQLIIYNALKQIYTLKNEDENNILNKETKILEYANKIATNSNSFPFDIYLSGNNLLDFYSPSDWADIMRQFLIVNLGKPNDAQNALYIAQAIIASEGVSKMFSKKDLTLNDYIVMTSKIKSVPFVNPNKGPLNRIIKDADLDYLNMLIKEYNFDKSLALNKINHLRNIWNEIYTKQNNSEENQRLLNEYEIYIKEFKNLLVKRNKRV